MTTPVLWVFLLTASAVHAVTPLVDDHIPHWGVRVSSRCQWHDPMKRGTTQCVRFLGHATRMVGVAQEPRLCLSDARDPTMTLFDTNVWCFGVPASEQRLDESVLGQGYANVSGTRGTVWHNRTFVPVETSTTCYGAEGRALDSVGGAIATRYASGDAPNTTNRLPYNWFEHRTFETTQGHTRHPERFDVRAQPVAEVVASAGGLGTTAWTLHGSDGLAHILMDVLDPVLAYAGTAFHATGYSLGYVAVGPPRAIGAWCGPDDNPVGVCRAYDRNARGCAGWGACPTNATGTVACSGHGGCTRIGHCHCDRGWAGDACNISYTAGNYNHSTFTCATLDPCGGRGHCIDHPSDGPVCDCYAGWEGSLRDTFDSSSWYASHILAEGTYGAVLDDLPWRDEQLVATRSAQQCVIWMGATDPPAGFMGESRVADIWPVATQAHMAQPVRPYACNHTQHSAGGPACTLCDKCDLTHSRCVARVGLRHNAHVKEAARCICDEGYTQTNTSALKCDTPRCPVNPHTGTLCGYPLRGACPYDGNEDPEGAQVARAHAPAGYLDACVCAEGYTGTSCETRACPVDHLGHVCGNPPRDERHADTGLVAAGTPAANPAHGQYHVPELARGACNTTSGRCVCRSDLAGDACDYRACPRNPSSGIECTYGSVYCNRRTGLCDCVAAVGFNRTQRTWNAHAELEIIPGLADNGTYGDACQFRAASACRPSHTSTASRNHSIYLIDNMHHASLSDSLWCSGHGVACQPTGQFPWDLPLAAFECVCMPGYSGRYCERDVCNNACGDTGTCIPQCRDTAHRVYDCPANYAVHELHGTPVCRCTYAPGLTYDTLATFQGTNISEGVCTTARDAAALANCGAVTACNNRAVCRAMHTHEPDHAQCGLCEAGFRGSATCANSHGACASCSATQYCNEALACKFRPTFTTTAGMDRCTATGGTHSVNTSDPRYGFDCVCPQNTTWYTDPGGDTAWNGCRVLCGDLRGVECGQYGRCSVVYPNVNGTFNLTEPQCTCSCRRADTNATGCTGNISDIWLGPSIYVAQPWIEHPDTDGRSSCAPLCGSQSVNLGNVALNWCNCSASPDYPPINGTAWDGQCFPRCNGHYTPNPHGLAMCACASGFTGNQCENSTCASIGMAWDYTHRRCECVPPYTRYRHNETLCTPICKNGGTHHAVNDSCTCPIPYSGPTCERVECAHHGTIDTNATCVCDTRQPAWGGPRCNTSQCVHGTPSPHNGTCDCYTSGVTGTLCEVDPCLPGGTLDATTHQCVCNTLGTDVEPYVRDSVTETCASRCYPGVPVVVLDDSTTLWYCDCPQDYVPATDLQSCVHDVRTTTPVFINTSRVASRDFTARAWNTTQESTALVSVPVCAADATLERADGWARCRCNDARASLTVAGTCYDPCTQPGLNVSTLVTGDDSWYPTEASVYTACACYPTSTRHGPFRSCSALVDTQACRHLVRPLATCADIINFTTLAFTNLSSVGRSVVPFISGVNETVEQFLNYHGYPFPATFRTGDAALAACACDPRRWSLPQTRCDAYPCSVAPLPLVDSYVAMGLVTAGITAGTFIGSDYFFHLRELY